MYMCELCLGFKHACTLLACREKPKESLNIVTETNCQAQFYQAILIYEQNKK